jgi:hypothetical protein
MTASDPGFDPRSTLEEMVAKDPPPPYKSAFVDLLDQALAAPRDPVTHEDRWVEDGPGRGHWERIR